MIALGGNSLSRNGQTGTIQQQFEYTRDALNGISHFIEQDYNICINHGNGPQVGNELIRMELTQDIVPPLPLGVCVAGTQGTIGYMIQQSLQNKLREMNKDREVVSLISQVIVNDDGPSFKEPTKYVGPRYSKIESEKMAKKFNWVTVLIKRNPSNYEKTNKRVDYYFPDINSALNYFKKNLGK